MAILITLMESAQKKSSRLGAVIYLYGMESDGRSDHGCWAINEMVICSHVCTGVGELTGPPPWLGCFAWFKVGRKGFFTVSLLDKISREVLSVYL
jgi:hypothetical protein